jgi:hypothetical protein
MVAGIVLVALGMKKTIGDVSDPLDAVPAFALAGGLGLYLLALVAFRYRHIQTINSQRLVLALALFALVPLVAELPALTGVALVTAPVWALIAFETVSYGSGRDRVRHGDFAPGEGHTR